MISPTTTSDILAVAGALHLDSRVGEPPLARADSDILLDPAHPDRARRFGLAFLGAAETGEDWRIA